MSPTKGGTVAAAVILPVCGTLAVALRFYVRVAKNVKVQSDDWTILVALVR